MELKHSSKQVVPITFTPGKKLFATATFEVCVLLRFRQSKKTCVYVDLHVSFLHFYRREGQINTVYEKYI